MERIGSSLAVEGATTARVFKIYVKRVLTPSFWSGQIVVMDNLGAHRPGKLIEKTGCKLLYLPVCSPDYEPTAEALVKTTNLLRRAADRVRGILVEAMGVALSAVTAADARGFFEHAGYRRANQPL